MQSQNRFFDDLARVAAGAVGALSEVKSEVEARLREQLEKLVGGLDLVDRDEFEAVKAMAAKARAEQEDLAARLAALEARFAAPPGEAVAADPTPDPAGPDPRSD
jgi:BMFP domain-containing protein YqiC